MSEDPVLTQSDVGKKSRVVLNELDPPPPPKKDDNGAPEKQQGVDLHVGEETASQDSEEAEEEEDVLGDKALAGKGQRRMEADNHPDTGLQKSGVTGAPPLPTQEDGKVALAKRWHGDMSGSVKTNRLGDH